MPADSGKKLFVGPRFRRVRQQLGLSQTQIAEGLGISPSYVNLIERNQRPVTAQILLRLAETYDLDLRDLATADEDRFFAELNEIFSDPLFRQIDVPKQDLRGDGALVALDQVDIARRKPKAFRHLGLRQPELLADAPEARADEQFLTGIGRHDLSPQISSPVMPGRVFGRDVESGRYRPKTPGAPKEWPLCNEIYKTTYITSLYVTSHHHSKPSSYTN